MLNSLTSFDREFPFLVAIVLVASVAARLTIAFSRPERFLALGLTFAAFAASIVMFSYVFETRVFVALTPLLTTWELASSPNEVEQPHATLRWPTCRDHLASELHGFSKGKNDADVRVRA